MYDVYTLGARNETPIGWFGVSNLSDPVCCTPPWESSGDLQKTRQSVYHTSAKESLLRERIFLFNRVTTGWETGPTLTLPV